MKARKMVSFEVTPDLIQSSLGLPDDVTIVGAEWNFSAQTLRLYKMKIGKMVSFEVTPDLIQSSLGLPDDVTIVGAEWNFSAQTLRLYVESSDFPEVEFGNQVPNVTPSITEGVGENGIYSYTWDWNIPKR